MLIRICFPKIIQWIWLPLLWIHTACISPEQEDAYNQKIWFKAPAEYWNSQALHLGNGYFGASFFGGTHVETFSLSEASMWTGEPAQARWERAGVNPRALTSLPTIRNSVMEGEMRLADSLISANFFGSSGFYGHFTSIGDLRINFISADKDVNEYHRELDLSTATGRVSF
jgi:alpha-L-fucosidase 2